MRNQFDFVFDSGCVITVVAQFRGQAIQLLSDTLNIPKDFIKSHCKITNQGGFASKKFEVKV